MRHLTPKTARLATGAFLTLLVGFVCAPASARAGCVHPSLLRSQRVEGTAHFVMLSRLGALAGTSGDAFDRPALPARDGSKGPCPGGSCSKAPTLPAAPTAPTAPPRAEQWALSALDAPPPAIGGLPLPTDAPRVRPLRSGLGVFHPPRTGAAGHAFPAC